MTVQIAYQTLNAIDEAIYKDQGAAFRVYQGQVMPHMGDAFRGEDGGFRSHLGASMIGKECGRKIWYGWRWMRKPKFQARMLRLFNRGHLEEARFIAMLLSIGVQVYQQDDKGNQYRISDAGGHFGGSGDGIALGIPDVPPETWCLLEFKTHGEKSFIKLQKSGVRLAKPEHYVQMQIYMHKMGLRYALYGAVNKNTDELYFEIIQYDQYTAEQYLDRGIKMVFLRQVPDRIPHASPSLFECRYCDEANICYGTEQPERNCRTCMYAHPQPDGTWTCENKVRQLTVPNPVLTKERQLVGCADHYEAIV